MSEPIRIGIIAPCPPPYGGIARVIENNVALWEDESVELHFLPMYAPVDAEPPVGAEFHRLSEHGDRSRSGVRAFIRALIKAPITRPSAYRSFVNYNRALSHFVVDRKLDALYAPEVWPAGASANLQSRLHDVASVVVAYGESYGTTPEHRRWARSMPDILKNADHVVASSEHCLDGAVRFGANRSQSSVVYAGVDVDRFRPDIECASWREAHNIAPDAFVVSVLGLVLQRKIEVFLDAISKTESDNLVFLIGGRGPDEAYVRNRLQGKNSDKVFPLGFVEEERLPEFYSASDVLVVSPNTELECMGQSMKEAMACGTPVIGAEIGGVPEAIEDGITGLMYDPNSPLALARAIDLLAESVDLRQQISAQSRDIAIERFDARVSATKTLNAIRTAIEHRKARK